MSRMENKAVMGYFAIEPQHHPAIVSLVHPATPAHRMLDPYAGEGEFLAVASQAWNVTPYANELDGNRADKCLERFGATQAVRCDVQRLSASTGAFSVGWFNPPYDHDAQAKNSKRVEFVYLRHAWKWLQDGGLAMWCVYQHHLTEEALTFFAKNSCSADVWALPGKHLGAYDQVIVVAVKGLQADASALYQDLVRQKEQPRPLTVQSEPVYTLPKPPTLTRFVFAPDVVDEAQGLRLLQEQGAWKNQGFQALLDVPPPQADIVPPVAPRPGHTALVLAAGIADGAVIASERHGLVALRGKTRAVEVVTRVDVEADERDPAHTVKKTTLRLKPSTTLTLLASDGTVTEMQGDAPLLQFIREHRQALANYLNTRFRPLYRFDMNGLGKTLERIKLKGKYPLYLAQRHVIAALTRAFEERDALLLIGQMGVGKTALGAATAIAIASGAVKALQADMKPNQVILVVCPPHLVEKWKREILAIHPNAYVQQLNRHEEVKAFMDKAELLGANVPKVGLIKRDMTKLGAPREPAVVWRTVGRALWRRGEAVPKGYQAQERIERARVPHCPNCGAVVYQNDGGEQVASATWLKAGKRSCSACHSPLWQEVRDSASQVPAGEKFATKNPRVRLDDYLKRHYRDRVYMLIWDEIHEAQHGDTGNGVAFGRLAGVAKKVLAMTGTPFNGRASSLFNLEYHLNPRVRQRYNWGGATRYARKERGAKSFAQVVCEGGKQRGRAESRWVDDMGVRERICEERPTYDSVTGAYTGTTTYQRPYTEAPGISPLLVAEVLDHAIFFSLGDLSKALPEYQEIALPVTPDNDVAKEYKETLALLKEYLIKRRWEGDASFRGAYLQWAMGWVNTAHLPYTIVHNLKVPFSTQKHAINIRQLPSLGAERVYAKEQALMDLVRAELAEGRACVVYVRQTQTRDLQPRLAELLKAHVPDAKPYILKNTVTAERREATLEAQVKAGANVVICNPELVKTGLDLVAFSTLIYYEISFNLATMMQASARSYRLNQTQKLCKVYFMFYEGTMEQHAVQLMSRKQRAAKLLNGELGLTGLDALTEGEGGLEEALLQAIGREESLIDPHQLFKTDDATATIDAQDSQFWNVETATPAEEVPATPAPILHLQPAEALPMPALHAPAEEATTLAERICATLAGVSTLAPERLAKVQARVLSALVEGGDDEDARTRWLIKYLRSEKVAPPDALPDLARALMALHAPPTAPLTPLTPLTLSPRTPERKPRRKVDWQAIPDDTPVTPVPARRATPPHTPERPQQLALFASPPHAYA
jgi:superfamily II DNA or RNA helicase